MRKATRPGESLTSERERADEDERPDGHRRHVGERRRVGDGPPEDPAQHEAERDAKREPDAGEDERLHQHGRAALAAGEADGTQDGEVVAAPADRARSSAWPTAPTARRARKPASRQREALHLPQLGQPAGGGGGVHDLEPRLGRRADERRQAGARLGSHLLHVGRGIHDDVHDVELEALDQLVVGRDRQPRPGVVPVVGSLGHEPDPADDVVGPTTVSPVSSTRSPTSASRSDAVFAARTTSSGREATAPSSTTIGRGSSTGSEGVGGHVHRARLQHALAAVVHGVHARGARQRGQRLVDWERSPRPEADERREVGDLAEALRVFGRVSDPGRERERADHPDDPHHCADQRREDRDGLRAAPAVEGEARPHRHRRPGPRPGRRARRPSTGGPGEPRRTSGTPPTTTPRRRRPRGAGTAGGQHRARGGRRRARARARTAPPCPWGTAKMRGTPRRRRRPSRPRRPARGPAAAGHVHLTGPHADGLQDLEVRGGGGHVADHGLTDEDERGNEGRRRERQERAGLERRDVLERGARRRRGRRTRCRCARSPRRAAHGSGRCRRRRPPAGRAR